MQVNRTPIATWTAQVCRSAPRRRWSRCAKRILAACAAAVCACAAPGQAAIYSIGYHFTQALGLTEVRGTIATSLTGTFETEPAIENLFNTADYSFQGFSGSTLLFTLNNANSVWDLDLGLSSASVKVTVTPVAMTIDFSTPIEPSFGSFVLYSAALNASYQFGQGNNVSDENFVYMDRDLVLIGLSPLPYDTPFVYPAVPEPSSAVLGLLGLLALRFIRATNSNHQTRKSQI